jgi:hypothetical protein
LWDLSVFASFSPLSVVSPFQGFIVLEWMSQFIAVSGLRQNCPPPLGEGSGALSNLFGNVMFNVKKKEEIKHEPEPLQTHLSQTPPLILL